MVSLVSTFVFIVGVPLGVLALGFWLKRRGVDSQKSMGGRNDASR